MNRSIWMMGQELSRFPRLRGDLKTDVLIVGGGMAGLLCAWHLQQAGVDYALVEADRICGGVTGKTTAKITSQHGRIYEKLSRSFGADTARGYWQANDAALAKFREIANGIPCGFETRDSYLYTLDDARGLESEMAALLKLGIPAEYVTTTALPFSVQGAIRFANQAQFHPLQFAEAVSQHLHIYEQTPAQAFAPRRVQTPEGTITAEKIIVATHFPILNKHGGYFLKLYQSRSYVLALESAGQVDGIYLDASGHGLSLRNAEDYLLVGCGGHRTGADNPGWAPAEAFAAAHYPKAKTVGRWANQDCMSLDGMPYIGRYSAAMPDVYVAAGFNKWGMTGAMVSAMILTELVQGRDHPWAALFSPQRSVWHPQLFSNAASAGLHLLTPTKPRCPHMGCALKWNPREHSWDCPCHGSRFSAEGKLLDNPATGDLDLP